VATSFSAFITDASFILINYKSTVTRK